MLPASTHSSRLGRIPSGLDVFFLSFRLRKRRVYPTAYKIYTVNYTYITWAISYFFRGGNLAEVFSLGNPYSENGTNNFPSAMRTHMAHWGGGVAQTIVSAGTHAGAWVLFPAWFFFNSRRRVSSLPSVIFFLSHRAAVFFGRFFPVVHCTDS